MKKILSIILSVTIILSLCTFAAAADDNTGLPDKITENENTKPFSTSYPTDLIGVSVFYNIDPEQADEDLTEEYAGQFFELMGIVTTPGKQVGRPNYHGMATRKMKDRIIINLKKYEIIKALELDMVKSIECHSRNNLDAPECEVESTFLAKNSLGWNNFFEYALDDDGNELLDCYPGFRMKYVWDKDGNAYANVQIPKGATKIILTNGDGDDSVEITDFTSFDYYEITGEKDDNGKYRVAGYVFERESDTEPVLDPSDYPPTASTFWLTDRHCVHILEEAYVYAWDADGNKLYGAFPGKKLTEYYVDFNGHYAWEVTVPEGAAGLYVNNGNEIINRWQTADITDFSFEAYDLVATYVGEGSGNKVEGYDFDKSDCTFSVLDTLYWGEAYLYALDFNGNEITGAWPGTKITTSFINSIGYNEYVITVPYNTLSVVISSNSGDRTNTMKYFANDGLYWMPGTKNKLGEYYITDDLYDLPVPDPSNPLPDSPTEPDESVLGDVNGDKVLDILDATDIQKLSVDKISFTAEQLSIGDFNKDGVCDVLDAVDIQKAVVM